MSEHQYYEFQAIDRPLSQADQEALRSLSSRAKITATHFINTYNYGDFGGKPAELMERWFDLHLYLANWGTRRLMIRLPKRFVDPLVIAPFISEIDDVELRNSGSNVILDIHMRELGLEDWEDGSGVLDALAPRPRASPPSSKSRPTSRPPAWSQASLRSSTRGFRRSMAAPTVCTCIRAKRARRG